MTYEDDGHWLDSLTNEQRELVFAWMREKGDVAQALVDRGKELQGPSGSIPVGSAWFDVWIEGAVIEEFLRQLRKGRSPTDAVHCAQQHARSWVATHNKRRTDVEWRRDETTAYHHITRMRDELWNRWRRPERV